MLLWMFNNLFYTTFIVGVLLALGGSTVYREIKQTGQDKALDKTAPLARRIATAIVSSIFIVPGIVGFVLALYADYMAQGTVLNRWASTFIIGVVLVALLYGSLPDVVQWINQRMRKEK